MVELVGCAACGVIIGAIICYLALVAFFAKGMYR